MRASEITYGALCWTMVSGKRTPVEVCSVRSGRGRKYAVRRRDGGALTALRSARALHICGHGYWTGLGEPLEREEICEPCRAEHAASIDGHPPGEGILSRFKRTGKV